MLDKNDKDYIAKIMKQEREEYQRFSGAMFENLEEQIKILAEAVAGILEKIQEMSEEMRVMRSDLKFKADRDEMILLERRVLKLERHAARG